MQDAEKIQDRLVADRKVRAVAQAGSYGTDEAWAGSQPTLVAFERGLLSPHTETRAGVTVHRFPYEKLEAWRDWDTAREEAPIALLATSRVAYDPTGNYGRIQRTLWNLNAERLAAHREDLLNQAAARLETARRTSTGPGSGMQEQLLALAEARAVAVDLLYPALLTHLHGWPEFEIRLPHAWRAAAGLRFPKAVYHLDNLYGFGGEAEARRVLLATRGLGLLDQEKRARAAFQAGYYDGAVRYLRDETARTHSKDLERWAYLSSARRDKLGVLLGVTLSPLGPAALAIAGELLVDAREGR
ncbi:hypothetical protein E5F05_11340 [Deinococcus metallilatus]|uniref:Uncharacterized protein n=1 Tax=Deinococcus metallilatus TaxID=1211322 RepID=A0AAJ5F2V3_9DEIO|nr:hypothetical protein [Deinococcus metallilatus]MBB5296487.1 hypothetical protein [Deinococcus metallilatus]QBY08480.1 hypothetical protein E5F05_11340 [Deinococcus metallilatus]RXJ11279.1 hypothetical protein ERJ73_10160 [Deinococcus metallilatus]TLK24770.1 hypothetical protein FCS05_14595 [Deinococcus metallilatus]GMA17404.1 hypothetical protein GCM10025871_37350 [Deinococcus metallilatus]